MIKRIYFLFILLVSQVGMTWVPPESFDSAYIEVEEAILSATIKGGTLILAAAASLTLTPV